MITGRLLPSEAVRGGSLQDARADFALRLLAYATLLPHAEDAAQASRFRESMADEEWLLDEGTVGVRARANKGVSK